MAVTWRGVSRNWRERLIMRITGIFVMQKEGGKKPCSHENCCLQGSLAGESPCLAVYYYWLWIAANIVTTYPLPSSHVRNKLALPLGGCCYPCLVAKSCLTLVTPWGVACQAPLSMGCPRQEYWDGLPFPPPGDLPNPGIEPECPALAGGCFTTEPPGQARQPITSFCSPLQQQGPQ